MNVRDIVAIASVWEAKAPALFDVHVKSADAARYLQDFVQAVNLSEALLHTTPHHPSITFFALSLKQDGSPVEVMNSDLGFNLVYCENVSGDLLQHVVDALQPYPAGELCHIVLCQLVN